ncbi:hypothetical protein D3C81_2241410 [compost metagenome]
MQRQLLEQFQPQAAADGKQAMVQIFIILPPAVLFAIGLLKGNAHPVDVLILQACHTHIKRIVNHHQGSLLHAIEQA